MNTPFRYDFVGSFLRPLSLKEARKQFEAGTISKQELVKVEDACIEDLIAKQKTAGYHVITDGEFRRATWHLDFFWEFNGVGHTKTKTGLPFHGEAAMIDDTYLTGKISYNNNHSFLRHFEFVNQFEDENTVAKLTIPAPAQFLEQMIMPFAWENTSKYYDTQKQVAEDIVKGYRAFIKDIYAAGCRNLQLDDCSWGMVVDPSAPVFFGTTKAGLEKIKEQLLDVNKENVNAYYLEFDDERSGGFECLQKVSGDKKVVLGLITTKSPKLEDKQKVINRIHEAAKYVPLERLYLSPQCGFASCEIGNKLTEKQQWAKLALVKEIAQEVWGE